MGMRTVSGFDCICKISRGIRGSHSMDLNKRADTDLLSSFICLIHRLTMCMYILGGPCTLHVQWHLQKSYNNVMGNTFEIKFC